MITLIKQTEDQGIVTDFWVCRSRKSLFSKLAKTKPDPTLRFELTKQLPANYKKIGSYIAEFKVANDRYTLMVNSEAN